MLSECLGIGFGMPRWATGSSVQATMSWSVKSPVKPCSEARSVGCAIKALTLSEAVHLAPKTTFRSTGSRPLSSLRSAYDLFCRFPPSRPFVQDSTGRNRLDLCPMAGTCGTRAIDGGCRQGEY